MLDMKLYFFVGFLLAFLFIGAGCDKEGLLNESTDADAETAMQDTNGEEDKLAQDTMFSNPATLYCLQEGGEFKMRKTLNGTTEGFCVLPNRIQCEVWAYYHGECPESDLAMERASAEDDEEADAEHGTRVGEELGLDDAEEVDELDNEDVGSGDDAEEGIVMDEEESPSITATEEDEDEAEVVSNELMDVSLEPGEEDGEVVMFWDIGEQEAPDGFFVMVSSKEDLTYPTPFSHAVESSYSRQFTWTDLPSGKTYYFRFCIAQDDHCGPYSSVVSITLP